MRKHLEFFFTVAVLAGCKEPYNPPAITSNGSYLVVDGFINSSSDSTIITLNRTVSLASANTVNPVLHAIVAVESDQSVVFPLTETGNGKYVIAGLNLDNSRMYRLSIKTSGNEQYYSDYVAILNSPPIDSVNFTINNNGINIYVTTHDPTNTVKYYRWDYGETWIIHSFYDSEFISNGDTVLQRTAAQAQYTCWARDTSNTIFLASTATLSKSAITGNLLTTVGSTSEKLSLEYSILVRQYALSGDAYNFWINLKKNTEELGSIFDAQPSQINGNVYSVTNPTETVVGYIGAGKTSTQRIFVRKHLLPASWFPNVYDPGCLLDTFVYKYVQPYIPPVNQVNEFINYDKGAMYPFIPVNAVILTPGTTPIGYSAASPQCTECTFRGTTMQPPYWIY